MVTNILNYMLKVVHTHDQQLMYVTLGYMILMVLMLGQSPADKHTLQTKACNLKKLGKVGLIQIVLSIS